MSREAERCRPAESQRRVAKAFIQAKQGAYRLFLCAVYVILAVALLIPAGRALFRSSIPTVFSGYLLGISASYLLPFLTRHASLYESNPRGYTAALVTVLMYVFYVSVAYGITPSPVRRKRDARQDERAHQSGRNWTAVISTVLILLAPFGLAFYLHWQVGIDRIIQDLYWYGSAAFREYLAGAGPLAFLIYPLNGLVVYRFVRGWKSGWNVLLTVLVSAMWVFVAVLGGGIGIALLVASVMMVLACANQRVVAGVILGVLISASVIGYIVLVRTDPGLVQTAISSLVNLWTRSVDKLWSLAWVADNGGVTLLDSAVMPPADGWKYALLAYVPESVLPEKGHDTAHYVSLRSELDVEASSAGEAREKGGVGFSVGGPVESVLNLGYLGLLLQGLFWGALLSLCDSWVRARGDQVLGALLFVLSAAAPATSLFTHVTVFALSIVGYAMVFEKAAPARAPLKESIEVLSQDPDAKDPVRAPLRAGAGSEGEPSRDAPAPGAARPGDLREAAGLPDGRIGSFPEEGSGGASGPATLDVFPPQNGTPHVLPAPALPACAATAGKADDASGEGGVKLVAADSAGLRHKETAAGESGRPGGDNALSPAVPVWYSREEQMDEIDLVEIMGVLMKRWKIIVAIVIAAVGASALLSVAMPKRYEVSATVLVRDVPQARTAGVTPQTLAAFAVSDQVLRTVSRDTPLDVLRSSFNVKLDLAARVLTLTASAETANDAFTRAERWLEGFTVETSHLIGLKSSDEPLVQVFVGPSFPERPVSPRIALNVAVSLLLGAFAGAAAAFVLDGVEKARERSLAGAGRR